MNQSTVSDVIVGALAFLVSLGCAGLTGYRIGVAQEARLIAECPAVQGKAAATMTINKDGSYQCVYIRAQKWMAEYVKEYQK